MNKRQELDMMLLKSKLRVRERIQNIMTEWHGQQARNVDNPMPFESKQEQPMIAEKENVPDIRAS